MDRFDDFLKYIRDALNLVLTWQIDFDSLNFMQCLYCRVKFSQNI